MLSPIPPFGIDSVDAYILGYLDAKSRLYVPEIPPFKPVATDRSYYIAAGGSDTNAGTPAAPLKTIDAALTKSQRDNAMIPAFYYNRGDTFPTNGIAFPRGFQGFFGAYGEGNAPVIRSSLNSPYYFGSSNTVQVYGLKFVAGAVGIESAIIGNGVTNLWVDSCEMEGFTFGVELTGGGNGFPRIYRNNIHDQLPAPTSLNHCSGIYIQGANKWDIQGNSIQRIGMIDVNPADPNAVGQMMMRHGFYGNESSNTGNGIFRRNLVLEAVGSAVGSRVGGDYSYNVFRGGGDFHLIVQGNVSNVTFNAFFGPLVDAAPNWGGGVEIISDNCLFANNWFSGNQKIINNPYGMVKAGTTTAYRNRGFWTKPTIAVMNPPTLRPGITVAPTAKLVTADVMPDAVTAPTGDVPTLASFPLNVGASVVPQILDYMNRSFRV